MTNDRSTESLNQVFGSSQYFLLAIQAGDEIVLTRHGHPAVRLVPVKRRRDRKALRALVEEIWATAKPSPGPSAARSQDFLYDEDGLPK